MLETWKIQYYKTSNGTEPVYDFIELLSLKAKTKLYNTFELLSEYGTQLGLPHVKKLTGTPLWELRILGENNIRVMYVARMGKIFLLLHGFVKKKQKTSMKDISVALTRLREYNSRH